MDHVPQLGGASCSLCGAPGTNKSTCPLNPDAKNPNFARHAVPMSVPAPLASVPVPASASAPVSLPLSVPAGTTAPAPVPAPIKVIPKKTKLTIGSVPLVKVLPKPKPASSSLSSVEPRIATSSSETLFDVRLYETDVICNNSVDAAHMLKVYGCVVVPCFDNPSDLVKIHRELKDDIVTYPEYRGNNDGTAATASMHVDGTKYRITVHPSDRDPKEDVYEGDAGDLKKIVALEKALSRYSGSRLQYNLGAFQALGNPSSFHSSSARKIRMQCHLKCRELLQLAHPNKFLEMNYDRVGFRQAGTEIPADDDKWHRDIISGNFIQPDDIVYGGWINLDVSGNQRLICVLGSQSRDGVGFSKASVDDGVAHSVQIPPGHVIIFYQHILHAIAPKKFKTDSYRQFISWRVTDSELPIGLKPSKDDTIIKQLVPQTPAGGDIKVWMSNHHLSSLLWTHTIAWTLVTFKRDYVVKKTSAKGGATYYIPEFPMTPRYPLLPYSDEDILIMYPNMYS